MLQPAAVECLETVSVTATSTWFRCRAFVVHVRVRAVQQYTLETKYTQNVFVIIIIIIIILFAQYYNSMHIYVNTI